MHFLRFQEYYESKKYFHKFFTLIDFMEWYSQEHGEGCFTYPNDWGGFNVPSECLLPFIENIGLAFPDKNHYDDLMIYIINQLRMIEGDVFYLIGTSEEKNDQKTLDHELAHALYFTNLEYRKKVQLILDNMPPIRRNKAKEILLKIGYHESTHDDEIHAYSSTEICQDLIGVIPKKTKADLKKLFREFKNKK